MISCVSISYFRQWYSRRLVEFGSGDFQFHAHFSRLSRHFPEWRCNFREAWNWYLEYSEVLLKCRKINLYLINWKWLWMETRKGKDEKDVSLSFYEIFFFLKMQNKRAKFFSSNRELIKQDEWNFIFVYSCNRGTHFYQVF